MSVMPMFFSFLSSNGNSILANEGIMEIKDNAGGLMMVRIEGLPGELDGIEEKIKSLNDVLIEKVCFKG